MRFLQALDTEPALDVGAPPALIAVPREITHVTQPFMPPLDEFIPYLEKIWANRWLTNSGPFHEELEAALVSYLGVPYVSLTANGTIALWLALQALGVRDEVITTPFSFVATAHALRLVNCTPVFVDIDAETGNLDPAAVEAAITERTRAILPVHCFGQPCDVEALGSVAERNDLPLIYDAAHAFGVRIDGRSVLNFGELATLSFHATKVFNTFEGGAIVSHDRRMKARIDRLRNFGFNGDVTVAMPSINGKMNEIQAAFGLLQLRHVDHAIARRAAISARYREGLADVAGITVLPASPRWTMNHAYFPVRVRPGHGRGRDDLWARLQDDGILARRYFHPLISEMPGYRDLPSARAPLPIARRMAAEILCLPLHPQVPDAVVDRTVAIITGG